MSTTKKKVSDEHQLKDRQLSLRLDAQQEEYVKHAMDILSEQRMVGANRVTKTEAVLVLLSLGMEAFNKKYGTPVKKSA